MNRTVINILKRVVSEKKHDQLQNMGNKDYQQGYQEGWVDGREEQRNQNIEDLTKYFDRHSAQNLKD